jgi:hypothetical protein
MHHFYTKHLEHARMFLKVQVYFCILFLEWPREFAKYEPAKNEGWLLGTEGEW